MRSLPLLPLAFVLAITPALAQVSVNNQALESLGASGGPPAHHPPPHHPAPHHEAPRRRPVRPAHPEPTHPEPARRPAAPAPSLPTTAPPAPHAGTSRVPPVPGMPAAPTIPTTPPPGANLAPPTVAPEAHPPAPPPPVPVVNSATGETATIAGGVRITFGAGSADLNPTTLAAVQKFARLVKDQPVGIDVIATAAGSTDDPSTPRRISLSRALAVRAVLINEGIPSTRIYPRAMGPNIGDGPPDRVDIVEHKVTPAPNTEPKQ